jgi:type I restriction enzyme S subunit
MSKTWPMVPLGEVLTQYPEYIEAPEPKLYPKLSVKLYGKGVVLDAPTDGSSLKMKRHQIAKSGQVILSEIWGKKGAIGFVPPEGEGALCTSHFFLFDVRVDKIEPKYLQTIFTANYLQDQLDAEAKGTTGYAAVRPKHLLAAKIPLPPLPEQQRIVARIEELASKIEEARGLRRQAVEEAATFVSSLHLNLAQERVVKIGDILRLDEYREEVQFGRQYPQVGVKGFGQGLFLRETLDATQTTYRAFNRLYDGAVVLSQVKGWEGAIAVCQADLAGKYVSPEYRTFRCIEGMAIPKYLVVLVATPWFWTQLKNITRGVGARRERTRPEQFLQIEIPMPRIDQQKQAILIFEKLETMKGLQAETTAELDALLPSVLYKAFRGEL